MKTKFLAIMLGAVLVLGACGGDKAKEEDKGTTGTGNETASVDVEKVVSTSCIACHGGNLELKGGVGPDLSKVGDHMSETEIHDVIINGRGSMPPGLIKGEEADAVAKWLAEKK
ncbi:MULTISPECIES: cytochrome c551 [Sporosarcina]|jgi:cytochrome c551|uniref:cytochrome c551 n=1 Tax=Sporosarcina TaxID=1569 RepID=UPI00078CF77F|nr:MULTISPECIES: cytochrome c [Sporosarcina]AMQ07515.1 cytochrome C551 [Sporosarcina psychrophila]QNK87209.1 cytochrome c [Sporosarcina sp. resist]